MHADPGVAREQAARLAGVIREYRPRIGDRVVPVERDWFSMFCAHIRGEGRPGKVRVVRDVHKLSECVPVDYDAFQQLAQAFGCDSWFAATVIPGMRDSDGEVMSRDPLVAMFGLPMGSPLRRLVDRSWTLGGLKESVLRALGSPLGLSSAVFMRRGTTMRGEEGATFDALYRSGPLAFEVTAASVWGSGGASERTAPGPVLSPPWATPTGRGGEEDAEEEAWDGGGDDLCDDLLLRRDAGPRGAALSTQGAPASISAVGSATAPSATGDDAMGAQLELAQTVRGMLECIVCRDVAVDPYEAQCCHKLVCGACSERAAQESHCPHCRARRPAWWLQPTEIARRMVNEMRTECPRCGMQCRVGERAEHAARCPHGQVRCKVDKCAAVMGRGEFWAHLVREHGEVLMALHGEAVW